MPINNPYNNPINNLTNSTTCQKKGDAENKPHSDKRKQMRKVSSPQSILTARPSSCQHQFGFKPNSSTVLCTTMLVETVQYYDENGIQPV